MKLETPSGDRRTMLLTAALTEAIDRMLQRGRTHEEIRERRLEGMMALLFELDPKAMASREDSVGAALFMPTMKPPERTTAGSPYRDIFVLIHSAQPPTPESDALASLLHAFNGTADFPQAIRQCRSAVKSENRCLVKDAVIQFCTYGLDSELREILWMLENLSSPAAVDDANGGS